MDDSLFTVTGGIDAKQHTAVITMKSLNHKIATGNEKTVFVIGQRTVTLNWSSNKIRLPYTGSTITPSSSLVTVGNTISGESLTVSFSSIGSAVGFYTPELSLVAGANTLVTNYKLPTNAAVEMGVASCYYYSGSSTTPTYYVRVEDAIHNANLSTAIEKIYIIVGANPTIPFDDSGSGITNNTITIASGDSLFLPYNGETYYNVDDWPYGSGSIKTLSYNDLSYRKLLLTIRNGIEIVNNGVIQIGGVINSGQGGVTPAGQTCGNHAQISLLNGSKITSPGQVYCYGFIYADNSSIVNITSGGRLELPFVVSEHRGGTNFSKMLVVDIGDLFGIKKFKTTPFNRFYTQNIFGTYIINYGASLYGDANMYASSKNNNTDVGIIGNNSIVDGDGNKVFLYGMTSVNSYVKSTCNPSNMTTKMEFYNGMNQNNLTMNLVGNTVTTEGVLLPVSHYYDIHLKKDISGTVEYNLIQDIKILPGGSITIDSGVTVNANKIIVYDQNEITGSKWYDKSVAAEIYPSNLNGGKLIINGTLNVNNIGGIVESTTTGGKLIVTNTISVSSTEVNTSATDYQTITKNLGLYMYDTNQLKTQNNGLSTGEYQSLNGYWINSSSYIIKYVYYNGYTGSTTDTSILNVNELYRPRTDVTRLGYEFKGWYLDSSYSVKWDDEYPDGIWQSTTLYAKWELIDDLYKLVFDATTHVDTDLTGVITYPNEQLINYEGTYLISKATNNNENLLFNGWYLVKDGNSFSQQIGDSISGKELLTHLNTASNTVTLYAYWTETSDNDVTLSFEYCTNSGKELILPNSQTAQISKLKLPDLTSNDMLTSKEYYFDNYYTDAAGTNKFDGDFETLFGESQEKTLYVNFKQKNTVIVGYVDPTSSSTEETSYFYKPDSNTLIPLSSLSISNYKHMGWKITSGGDDVTDEVYTDSVIINNATYIEAILLKIVKVSITKNQYATGTIYVTSGYYSVNDGTTFSTFDSNLNMYQYGYFYLLEKSTFTATASNVSGGTGAKIESITNTTQSNGSYIVGTKDINITYYGEKSGGCVAAGTLITMGDGSTKKVENIVAGDQVLVFNHEKGIYDVSTVMFNAHDELEWQEYEVINLHFNDGTILKIINEHTLFDTTLNKYVVITKDLVNQYLNHSFYATSIVNCIPTRNDIKLVEIEFSTEYTGIYNPLTYYHMNCFTEGLLSMPGDIENLINIFEYDENAGYDKEVFNKYIEEYGLYTYEDLKEFYSEEVFNALPLPYIKIAIERGMTTLDEVRKIIYMYIDLIGSS